MIKLFKNVVFVMLASLIFAVPVWAEEAEVVTESGARRIPYNVAVRGATRNLADVTVFDNAIDDMTEIRQQLQDMLTFRRRQGADRYVIIQLEREIGELGAQINTMRAAQSMVRTSTEFAMRNSITTINNTLLDIKLLEATLAHSRIEFENAGLRMAAGLISESDYNDAELALQAQEANLAALLVSLDVERQDLNRIIQRPVTGYYYVGFDRALIDLPTNLDQAMRRTISRQPNVRQREIARGRARATLNDQDAVFGSPERQRRQRDYDQATREYNDARRAVETVIRNQYNTLTMLLHNNESLEIELQRAEEQLAVVELNVAAGLATIFDIEMARLSILQAEVAIERNLNMFWNAQFIFENPFLMAR